MKFSREQLEKLLDKTELDRKGENLKAICPWCGKHEFGISILLEGNPFQCFRGNKCGKRGTIFTLLKHLGKLGLAGGIRVPENRRRLEKKITINIKKQKRIFVDLACPISIFVFVGLSISPVIYFYLSQSWRGVLEFLILGNAF